MCESELLTELLYGRQTVSAISRRFFCSERSMYRWIRRLYDELGVRSRSELRSRVATRRHAALVAGA
ncbi:hypothetical protein [Pseudonocardia sp. H11422]|uniref:hypothetical protein n=1 Tax=Pseudonocardia sp. H11422 TaxID=2835866 RepID=UPI001BDCC644|nr:hypothetical protein [Pseudonocardia sp. H11422]